MAQPKQTLADYTNPPVIETVIGVQFDRLSAFQNAHLGAFWKTLDQKVWNDVSDVAQIPNRFERFEQAARWAKGIQIQLTQDPSCRLQIKNADGNRMIQVQNGQLHLNWLGTGGENYPRYSQVRMEFDAILMRYKEFMIAESIGEVLPNLWEITYVNHIPKGTVWDTPEDWGFLGLLSGMPNIDGLIERESFNGAWRFQIPDQKGRLYVEWETVTNPDSEQNEFVRLTFTARGAVKTTGEHLQSLDEGLELGHQTIVRSFRELMSDPANRYWGENNA